MKRCASWGEVAAAAAAVWFFFLGLAGAAPAVVVDPPEVAVGQPFTARVEGAPPGSTVKWRVNANAKFLRADSMRREATFEATRAGEAVVTAAVGAIECRGTARVTGGSGVSAGTSGGGPPGGAELLSPETVELGKSFSARVGGVMAGASVDWSCDGKVIVLGGRKADDMEFRGASEGDGFVEARIRANGWVKRQTVTVGRGFSGGRKPPPVPPTTGKAPPSDPKIAAAIEVLEKYRAGSIDEVGFFRGMKARELAIRDMVACKAYLIEQERRRLRDAGVEGQEAIRQSEEYWRREYAPHEQELMSSRQQGVTDAINRALARYVQNHPDLPYIGAKMDVGGWASEPKSAMRFEGDIDFSLIMVDVEDGIELRNLFDQEIRRVYDLDMIEVDALATAHRAATSAVYIGDYGAKWAEIDAIRRGKMYKLKVVNGRIESKEMTMDEKMVMLAVLENNEHKKRTGQDILDKILLEGEPAPRADMEPGVSLEFLRHVTHDVIHAQVSITERIIKTAKYVNRSCVDHVRFLEKVQGFELTAKDSALAAAVKAITDIKQSKDMSAEVKLSRTMNLMTALLGEGWANDPEAALAELGRRAVALLTHNIEEGIKARQVLIEQIKDPKEADAERKRLLDDLENEFKAFEESHVAFPEAALKAMQDLANDLRRKGSTLPPQEMDRLAEFTKRVASHNANCSKLTMGAVWQRAVAMYGDTDKAIDAFNNFIDRMDNVTIQRLRESRAIELDLGGGYKISPGSINQALNESVLGSIGNNTVFKGFNLVQEGVAYAQAIAAGETWEDSGRNLATEIFRRRVPLGGAVDAYYQENYIRVGIEVVYAIFPPLAVPEGLVGMASMAAEWGMGVMENWKYEEMVDALYAGAVFEKAGVGGGWRMVRLTYKSPDGREANLGRDEMHLMPDRIPYVWQRLVPQFRNHGVIQQYEKMLGSEALSGGPLTSAGWPYEYLYLNERTGKRIHDQYKAKVNQLAREYFVRLIAEIERRKGWETGTGYAEIAAIDRELGCGGTLAKITGDPAKDREAFEKIVDDWKEIKETNDLIADMKQRWGADFLTPLKPECSAKSIAEVAAKARERGRALRDAEKKAFGEVEGIVGREGCTDENLRDVTAARLGMASYPNGAEEYRVWYERHERALDALRNKAAPIAITIIAPEKAYVGRQVKLGAAYDREMRDAEVDWEFLGAPGESFDSQDKDGAAWTPRAAGEIRLRVRVKPKGRNATEVTKSAVVQVRPASEAPQLKIDLRATLAEVGEDDISRVVAVPVSLGPEGKPLVRFFWSEDGQQKAATEEPAYDFSGGGRRGRQVKVSAVARDAGGEMTPEASVELKVVAAGTSGLKVAIEGGKEQVAETEPLPLRAAYTRKSDSGGVALQWSLDGNVTTNSAEWIFDPSGFAGRTVTIGLFAQDSKGRDGQAKLDVSVKATGGLAVRIGDHPRVVPADTNVTVSVFEPRDEAKTLRYDWYVCENERWLEGSRHDGRSFTLAPGPLVGEGGTVRVKVVVRDPQGREGEAVSDLIRVVSAREKLAVEIDPERTEIESTGSVVLKARVGGYADSGSVKFYWDEATEPSDRDSLDVRGADMVAAGQVGVWVTTTVRVVDEMGREGEAAAAVRCKPPGMKKPGQGDDDDDGKSMSPGDGGTKPPDGGVGKAKTPGEGGMGGTPGDGGKQGTTGTTGKKGDGDGTGKTGQKGQVGQTGTMGQTTTGADTQGTTGKKKSGPRQLRDISGFVITCPEMVRFGEEVRIQMKEPPSGYWGHIDFVWSHGRGGLYGTTFKPEQPGTYEVTIEFVDTTPTWPTTSLGKRSCRVVVPKPATLTVPKEVMETEIFDVKLDIAPEWAPKVKKYSFSGGEILTGQIEGGFGGWTSTPEIKMQFRPGTMRGNAAEVSVSAGACDAEGKSVDSATAKMLVRPVRMSATGGGVWKFAQLEDGIAFERQPAVRKRSENGKLIDSATALGHLSVRWDRFSRDQDEAKLKESVEAAAIWQSLPPAGASEGKIEVVPFAIGDFKGYMKRATTVVTRYNGNPWDYVDVCLPQANTAGSATLLKGKVTLNIYYSTGGSGMGLGTGKLWWDDMPFLTQHAAAADAEVKAMIGSIRLTPEQKIDSAPYTGPPLDGTGAAGGLQVAVKATPAEAKSGQTVEVAAEVTGGKAPYEYTWTGDHAGKGAKVTFISSKAGEHKLSVAVKDADGATGSGEVTIKVAGVEGQIHGLPGQVVYGQKVEIRGSVTGVAGAQEVIDKTNAENAKKQAEWDEMIRKGKEAEAKGGIFILPPDEEGPDIQTPQFKFIWHADKEGIAFDPPEGTSTTVLFGRMGAIKIWAQVLDKDGATLGETPQSSVNVVAPKFQIGFDPTTGRVGQEIRARVTTDPMTLHAPIFYRWSVPESSNRMEHNDSASDIGFKLKEPKPLRVTAVAEVPHYRDTIGNIEATFTPGAYAIKVTVEEFETTKPKVWDPVKGGIKTLPRGTYAGDEQIRLRAEIEGEPKPAEVRWKWKVNGGTTISNDISQTPTVSRHETGSIAATVEARDKDGVLLGTGSINLSVTVAPDKVNPVMVTAKADRATIRSGEKTWLRAEVKGGTTPYSYQWSGAAKGSAQAVEFLGEKAGDAVATVAVKDSKKKTGNAQVTVKVEPAEIAVSVSASKTRVFVGETVDLTASAKGGTEPYKFTWAAPAAGQAAKARFAPDKAGDVELAVVAEDKFGNKGEGKVKVAVAALEVTIDGLKDQEIVGASRALQVRTPLPGPVQAAFSAEPGLAFTPATAPQGKASVTFDQAGEYRVRAEAQVKRDNAWVTVGRSKDYTVSVVAPKMEIAFEPAEASVGQQVKAALKVDPPLATGTFDVAWKGLPGGAPAKGAQVAFKPTNTKPIEAVASVKAVPGGAAIGEAKGTFAAKPLEVKIEATASAGTQVWDAGRGEMVDLPEGKFAAGAAIGLTASLPDGFQAATFAWTTKGCNVVGSASGAAIRVMAQEKGSCEAEAVAKDRDGAEIGKGSVKLDITVSQEEIMEGAQQAAAKKAAELVAQAKKLAGEGKFEEAISVATQALEVDPQTAEAKGLIETIQAEAKAQKLVEEGYALEQAGKIAAAIEKYESALALVPDEKLAARIAALREKLASAGGMAGATSGGASGAGEGAMAPETPGGQTTPGEVTPPTVTAGSKIPVTVPPEIVTPGQSTGNVGGVQNGPTAPTLFKTAEPYVVTFIQTYHWNYGKGKEPGTVALRHSDGTTYGPWPTSGRDGQGGVKNAYWVCEPNVLLKPGTYTVIDSDPSSWAQNAEAGGCGFVEIKGATKRAVEVATGVKLPEVPGETSTAGPSMPPTAPTTPVAPPTADDVPFDGSYAGRFEGGAGGDIRFTVAGGRVNGTISGSYQGSQILGTFAGPVDAAGNMTTILTGKFINESQPYPFTGKILGALRGGSGAGTWDAENQWGKPKGEWRANRGGSTPPTTGAGGTATTPPATTATGGATLQARAENGGAQNVHIFVEGQDNFGPHNRVAPGGNRAFAIQLPPSGRVTFVAGRNGSVLARKTWDGDPDNPGRYPVVRFSEPNGLSVTTGLR